MLNWLWGRKNVEAMIAAGEIQWAIDTIHSELDGNPSPEQSRSLRLALAEALERAGRKVEAVAVLKDLSTEHLKAGHAEQAIAIQKRLEQLAAEVSGAGQQLDELASTVSHAQPDDVVPSDAKQAMAHTALFHDFTKEELVAVIGALKFRSFEPGEILMIEGEPGNSLYVLTRGTVRIYVRTEEQHSVQINELEAPAFFGEISIVYGKPRTATVSCMTYCEALMLDRPTVDRISSEHPRVRDVLKEFCDRRIAGADEHRGEPKTES